MATHQLPIINNEDIFEDLICDLFNLIENTNTFKRFGKKGHNQKGIDVFSSEKDFAIQCKKKDLSRRDVTIRKELFDDIEKDVNKIINKDLKIKISNFYVVSTYKDHPDIDEYCEELKEKYSLKFDVHYWGWDTLEPKIIERKPLLEKYWQNFIIDESSEEKKLKRNLSLKKAISTDFGDWLNYSIENRKVRSRMLLRQFDDKQYPDTNDPNSFGVYPWYRVEIFKLYHNGLSFITSTKTIQIFEDNTWDFVNENLDKSTRIVTVYEISEIHFSDIVEYDINGDEYYMFPHIFCKFQHDGSPYENKYYLNVEKEYETFDLKNKKLPLTTPIK